MEKFTLGRNGKIAIIIGLFIIGLGIFSAYAISQNTICPNLSINGVPVGRVTKDAALNIVKEKMEPELANAALTLKFNDKTWKLSYKDIEYKYNYEEAVDKAYSIGHEGNYFKRLYNTVMMQFTPQDIVLTHVYEPQAIASILGRIALEVNQTAADATIKLQPQGFVITDEIEGRRLNIDKASGLIKTQIEMLSSQTVDLPVDLTAPAIKRSDLENIKDKLGSYSTKFNLADADRTSNVALATKSASNVLVQPGQEFSLNQTIGPRLEVSGYKIAKVIVNNELVPGIGGGVCQVSSTLYNAAILSNLEIVERKNHSLPSAYVPLGRDATISGDYIDLKFKNNTNYPLYIYGEVKGSWVTFSIYGKNNYPGRTVKITTEVISTTAPKMETIEDPTLPVGTEIIEKKPYSGYVVRTYRTVYENGQKISSETLSTSKYKVADGVRRVGTKQPEVPLPDNMSQTAPQ